MAVSTDQLITILTGVQDNPTARGLVDYVRRNPGLTAAQRQEILETALPGAAPQPAPQTVPQPAPAPVPQAAPQTGQPPIVWNPQTGEFELGQPGQTPTFQGGVATGFTTENQPAPVPAPTPQVAPEFGTPEWVQWMLSQGFTAEDIQRLIDQQQAPKPGLVGQGPGELNVPFGADFLEPTLNAFTQLAGLQQAREQFQQSNLLNAARALANLRAQGPQSAAELAFLQAGMGFPAIGGSRAAIEDLVGASTRGATGRTFADFGNGQGVSIPNTLSGAQLSGLQGNPNLSGVLESFATAAGNPDIFKRSIAALVPSGFEGVGSGLF